MDIYEYVGAVENVKFYEVITKINQSLYAGIKWIIREILPKVSKFHVQPK